MGLLKFGIKRLFALFGLNLSRRSRVPSLLLQQRIDLLLDVGANVGQFARERRAEGYRGEIVSFEPLPDAHARLAATAAQDPHWTVHPRAAVGAQPGQTEINIAGNSQSSSLLPMLSSHSDAAPQSAIIGRAATDVITLDSVFDLYDREGRRVFLKIDTQGFEKPVLDGAARWLDKVEGIQLEMSVVPLYDGQEPYPFFLQFLRERGFELWSLLPGFIDPVSGRMLQFDAIFVRSLANRK